MAFDVTTNVLKEERKYTAFDLRKRGKTLRTIASELGVSHQQIAHDINEVLEEMKPYALDVEKYRQIEIERLERLLEKLDVAIDEGDYQALDRAIKINQRISALKGLEVQKHEIEVGEKTAKTFAEWMMLYKNGHSKTN